MRVAFGKTAQSTFRMALGVRDEGGWGQLAFMAGAIISVVAVYVFAMRSGGEVQSGLPLLAVFGASVLSAVVGFAFSAICGALLFQLPGAPIEIMQVVLLCSIVNQTLSIIILRRDIAWRRLWPFLAAGLLGSPLGVYGLLHSPTHAYARGFGCLLITCSSYALMRPPVTVLPNARIGDWVAGFLGGITGGIAAFPSAPVMVWIARRGWSKHEQRSIFQPYILAMQCMTLLVLTLSVGYRTNSFAIDPALLAYMPLSILGTCCGIGLFRRLSNVQFGMAVNLLLIIIGFGLIF